MPHYALVITDPTKHRNAEIARSLRHNLPPDLQDDPGAQKRAARELAARLGPLRAVGDLHTVAARECPEGRPNCEHCGDPARAATCRAAGHCPDCGTKHGIAPASVLTAGGLELVALPGPPADDDQWDPRRRAFVKRA